MPNYLDPAMNVTNALKKSDEPFQKCLYGAIHASALALEKFPERRYRINEIYCLCFNELLGFSFGYTIDQNSRKIIVYAILLRN